MSSAPSADTAATRGAVVHWAARYDLLVWLLTLGRERRFRERLLALAHLQAGESVLDVGCGTGTLAIAAKRAVGEMGEVFGVDPSPEMVARARGKAQKQGARVTFAEGVAESLPFPDGRFDVVVNTVMLHHLPKDERQQAVREMKRVLKPNGRGRVLAVDFDGGTRHRGLIARLHGHTGGVPGRAIMELFSAAGLQTIENGDVGSNNLQFALARTP